MPVPLAAAVAVAKTAVTSAASVAAGSTTVTTGATAVLKEVASQQIAAMLPAGATQAAATVGELVEAGSRFADLGAQVADLASSGALNPDSLFEAIDTATQTANAETATTLASTTSKTTETTWSGRKLGENLEITDPRPTNGNWQAHHVLPGNTLRDHPLAQEAIRRGVYDPDQGSNGIWLPNDESTRTHPNNAATVNLPEHRGPHPNYDNVVNKEMNKMLDRLVDEHGSLDAVPDEALTKAMGQLESRMKKHLAKNPNVRTNGRLS